METSDSLGQLFSVFYHSSSRENILISRLLKPGAVLLTQSNSFHVWLGKHSGCVTLFPRSPMLWQVSTKLYRHTISLSGFQEKMPLLLRKLFFLKSRRAKWFHVFQTLQNAALNNTAENGIIKVPLKHQKHVINEWQFGRHPSLHIFSGQWRFSLFFTHHISCNRPKITAVIIITTLSVSIISMLSTCSTDILTKRVIESAACTLMVVDFNQLSHQSITGFLNAK